MATSMNKITLNYSPCSPAPARGYNIQYRVAGSSDPMTNAGNFFIIPAVFYDPINPVGTLYEGFIRADCGGDVYGNPIYWNMAESGGSAEIPANNTFIVHVGGPVSITALSGIAGFTFVPPLTGGIQSGIHTAFANNINVTVSGATVVGSLKLQRNGITMQCINIAFAGPYIFNTFSWLATDDLTLTWAPFPC